MLTKRSILPLFLSSAAAVAFVSYIGIAQGSAAPNSPYFTDPQQTFSDDLLLEPFELTNDILCYYKNSLVRQFDDGEPYNVLINPTRCGGGAQPEDPEGDGIEADSFDRGRLVVTSDGGALTGASHWDFGSGDGRGRAWVSLTARSLGGSDEFVAHARLEAIDYEETFTMRSDGSDTAFRMESSEPDFSEEITGYIIKDENNDTGRGFLEIIENGQTESWRFGYTEVHFCRMNADSERCFLRQADQAFSDVWSYRLYELDGRRYETDEDKLSGMGIRLDKNGAWGHIDYNGVWFPQATLDNLADQEEVTAGGESYTLSYLRYRLDEYEDPEDVGLENINRMPFWIFGDGFNLEVYWDDDVKKFVVMGYDDEGELNFRAPEEFEEINKEYTLETFIDEFEAAARHQFRPSIDGWAYLIDRQIELTTDGDNSLGDATRLEGALIGGDRRPLNSGEVALPDGTTLYCENNCVTAGSIRNYIDTGKDPFSLNNQKYTVRSTPIFSLEDETGEVIEWPAGGTNANDDEAPQGARMDLYSEDPSNGTDLEFTFALELGPHWDSYVLYQGDEILDFVVPEVVVYQVPESADLLSGAILTLSFQGENLNVPGTCFDMVTNESVACSGDARIGWRDSFLIPFDEEKGRVRLLDGDESRELLVKWIRRAVTFQPAPSVTANSAGVEYGTPDEMTRELGNLSLCDPSDELEDCFVGQFPSESDFNEKPSVIHGDIQSD